MRVLFASAIVLIGLGTSLALPRAELSTRGTRSQRSRPYGLEKPGFVQLSSATCAAAACHGGGRTGTPRSEHTTWSPDAVEEGPADPHARAYRVLFNADSVRIARAMNRPAAHTDELCLKCHSVAGVKPAEAVIEGVGCGACHGPAEKWLTSHTRPDWKGLSSREKHEQGFVPLQNLVNRTLVCASCHVGDADREVDHDLIAAGHPRLAFESSSYHHHPDYRRHWEERTPRGEFAVRSWVVGQAATLRAATDLLRARAERANEKAGAWPEFSGYSCSSCHHRVWREVFSTLTSSKRTVGLPGWETWSNTAVGLAGKFCPEVYPEVSTPTLPELSRLREVMKKRSPDPASVARQARLAAAELDDWLARLQAAEDGPPSALPRADTARRFLLELAGNALTEDGKALADPDWDALAANYLGCDAMSRASGPLGIAPLDRARAALKVPVAGRQRFDKIVGFGTAEREEVRKSFGSLIELPGPREKPR